MIYIIFCLSEMFFAVVEMCYLVRTKTALFYLQNPDSNAKVTQMKKKKQQWVENIERERKDLMHGIDGMDDKGSLIGSPMKENKSGLFGMKTAGMGIQGPSLSHSIRFDNMNNVSMDETEHLKTS